MIRIVVEVNLWGYARYVESHGGRAVHLDVENGGLVEGEFIFPIM
jgi:hypothetical protein